MDSTVNSRKLGKVNRLALASMLVASLVLMGGGPLSAKDIQAGSPPEFVDSFAVSSLWAGQDWRIFVKGSDPGGQMDYIWIVVSQLGGNMWSNHVVRLKGDARSAFEGYITLPTPHFIPRKGWDYVRVEMRIKDKAGRYSEMRVHEVEIGSPTRESLPAAWRTAANNSLGTVFFDFNLDQGESSGLKGR